MILSGLKMGFLCGFIITSNMLINPSDCLILCNWVFDNFILADEPFAKALRIF